MEIEYTSVPANVSANVSEPLRLERVGVSIYHTTHRPKAKLPQTPIYVSLDPRPSNDPEIPHPATHIITVFRSPPAPNKQTHSMLTLTP